MLQDNSELVCSCTRHLEMDNHPIVQNVCVQMVVWIHGLILKENRFQPIDKIYQ